MEERQRLEIAERVRALRERSPYTQPEVAERLGIKLRGYQKLEKEGTTKFERCEEIFAIHKSWLDADPEWGHVSPGWIWDGHDRRGDLMGSLSEAQGREDLPRQVADALGALTAQLGEKLDKMHGEIEEIRQLVGSSGRTRKSTRN